MGNTLSIRKINCEDMQKACIGNNTDNYIIINTLEANMQQCLIKNTIQIEKILNRSLVMSVHYGKVLEIYRNIRASLADFQDSFLY
jgi:hypothetical protein